MDDAAGTLLARPPRLRAGDSIAVAVKNVGGRDLFYGLGFSVQRRERGAWRDVTLAALGEVAVRDIGLVAVAGETVGPRYGRGLADRFQLKPELVPGSYRAVKDVRSLGGVRPRPKLQLTGRFVVTPTR